MSRVSNTMLQSLIVRALAFALLFVCAAADASVAAAPPEIPSAHVIHCENVDDHRPAVVTGVAMTRDGRTIAAATDDHRVLVWDAATAELKTHFEAHSDWVHSVVLTADGTITASGG